MNTVKQIIKNEMKLMKDLESTWTSNKITNEDTNNNNN